MGSTSSTTKPISIFLIGYYYVVIIITCIINSDLVGVVGVDAAGPKSSRPSSSSSSSTNNNVNNILPTSYTISDVLDDLDLHSDNRVRPGYGERVLEIQTFAFLRNIVEINEVESTLTLNLLFMQMWDDPRVSFSPAAIINNSNDGRGVKEILIDNPEFMSRLWNPDTFIVNEVKTHACTVGPNLAHQIIRLGHTGSILKTSRLTVTVSCPMRHENYPFHRFECDVEMESFGHKTDDILFLWRNGSKSVDSSKIDRTSLAGRSSYLLQSVGSHSQQSYLDTGGSYSKLIIRLTFTKLWLRHAITFFIPTLFLTIISLGSLFWVLENNPSIGVVTNFIIAGLVVLLGGLEYSVVNLLTQVPFLTPVDIHLGICLTAIFSAVIFHGLALCLDNNNSNCIRTHPANSNKSMKASSSQKTHHPLPDSTTATPSSIPTKPQEATTATTYESYSDTLEGDHDQTDDDEEQNRRVEYKLAQRVDILERQGFVPPQPQQQQSSSNAVIVAEGGGGGDTANNGKKMSSASSSVRKTIMRGFFGGLLSGSLTISKWLTVASFALTECVFWYVYLATTD